MWNFFDLFVDTHYFFAYHFLVKPLKQYAYKPLQCMFNSTE